LEIKDLLYQRRYTIAGAKHYLKEHRKGARLGSGHGQLLTLEQIREELIAIRDLLSK
jgi:hypothetical protein